MTVSVNSLAARFLPKREFRSVPKDGASAPVTAGCNRVGLGQSLQVLCCVLVAVVLGLQPDAVREDGHADSINRVRAALITSASDTSRRLASIRSHASNAGGKWISNRWTFTRFLGGATTTNVANGMRTVNMQLGGSWLTDPPRTRLCYTIRKFAVEA
jgi:hypothetical protein